MIVSVSALLPSQQPISSGNPVAVDQEPDHDLGVDAAFLAVADLAEVVFLLCLEVERGDVVQHQADVTVDGGVVEARGRDPIAVVERGTSAKSRSEGVAMRGSNTQLAQDTHSLTNRGRLHDPGQHELEERLVIDDVEPQRAPSSGNDVDQGPRGLRLDHPDAVIRCRLHAEVELALALVQPGTSDLHQDREFGIGVGRPEMIHDDVATAFAASDLNRGGTRGRLHLPQEHHRNLAA